MSMLFLFFTTRTVKSMLSPHVGTATGRVLAMRVSRLSGTTLPLYEVPLYVICWPYCGRDVRWSLLGMESVPYLLSLSAGLVDLTSTRKGWRNRDGMKTNVGQYFGHLQDSWVVHLFVVFRSILHSVSYKAGNTTEASREVPLSASVCNPKNCAPLVKGGHRYASCNSMWHCFIVLRHEMRCIYYMEGVADVNLFTTE